MPDSSSSEVDERVEVVSKAIKRCQLRGLARTADWSHEILAALDAYEREQERTREREIIGVVGALEEQLAQERRSLGDLLGRLHRLPAEQRALVLGDGPVPEQDSPSDRDLLRALAAVSDRRTGVGGLNDLPAAELERLADEGLLIQHIAHPYLTDKAREAIRAAINREEA